MSLLLQLRVSDIITVASAEDDELFGAAFKGLREEDRASEVVSLVLYLATLIGGVHNSRRVPFNHRFAAYVAALPPSAAAATPQRWPKSVIAPLMGTSLAAALQQQKDVLDELCEEWLPRLIGWMKNLTSEAEAVKLVDGIGPDQVMKR